FSNLADSGGGPPLQSHPPFRADNVFIGMRPFEKKLFHLSDFPLFTKRLVIRPLRVVDAEPAYKFMDLDKDVSRFIHRANSLKQKMERFEKLVNGYEAENYGYFAIAPIESDEQMIGWVGL